MDIPENLSITTPEGKKKLIEIFTHSVENNMPILLLTTHEKNTAFGYTNSSAPLCKMMLDNAMDKNPKIEDIVMDVALHKIIEKAKKQPQFMSPGNFFDPASPKKNEA